MHARNPILAALLPTTVSLALALGVAACDSKSEVKTDAKSDSKSADKKDAKKADDKAAPAGPQKLDLAKIGLKADAPAGTQVSDGIGGGGVMVQGENLVVSVDAATDMTPKTIEDAKKDAEMYGPKNIKEEKLADGYALTFENEGGMGTNFHVAVRRDIGGKAWSCTTMQSNAEQQANALAFCKSLSK
jgi:hypothetical protein